MAEFKITMQEFIALVWAYARLKLEVDQKIIDNKHIDVHTVLGLIEDVIDRIKDHVEEESKKECHD